MFKWLNSQLSKRFFAVVLFSLLFTALVMSVLSIRSIKRLGESSARLNTASVEAHVRSFMRSLVAECAATRDAEFRAAASTVRVVAGQAAGYLDRSDVFGVKAARGKERFTYHKAKGIFSNGPDALVSSVYWDKDVMDARTMARVNAVSHADSLLVAAKEQTPGAVAAWLALADSIVRYYPNTHIVDWMPPRDEFDYRNDHCFQLGTPEKNPEGRAVWSDVYQDTVGQGLVVTVGVPLYSNAREFLGVTGIDLSLDRVVKEVLRLADTAGAWMIEEGGGQGGFSLLVDRDNRIIALPRDKARLMGLGPIGGKELAPGALLGLHLAGSGVQGVRDLARLMTRESGRGQMMLEMGGERYLATFDVMHSTGWRLGLVLPMEAVLAPAGSVGRAVESSVQRIILSYPPIAMAATLVSMLMVLVFIIRRLFSPMRSLLMTAQAVAHGQLEHRAAIPEGDEFGELARAMNHMIDELVKGRGQLREAEERYRSIFENAVEGVFRSTPEGRFLSVNPSMAEILGYDSPDQLMAEVKDISSSLYVVPEQRRQYLELLRRDGRVRHFETRLRRRDGSEIWGMFSSRAALGFDGSIAYIDGLLEDITQEREAKEEVLRLSRELMQAQEGERRRISRDLHDNVAQTLSSLRIGIGVLFDGYGDAPDEVRRKVEDFSGKLQQCIGSIRGMAYDLRPSALDELGLVRTLDQYCREYTEHTGIETEFVAPGMDAVELSADMEINLYRIIQEALHNVEKHSKADRVSVSLVASYPSVILLVTDNGRGFDPESPVRSSGPRSGMGLSSMRERARLLGGDLEIRTRPGVGVRLRVEVPMGLGGE